MATLSVSGENSGSYNDSWHRAQNSTASNARNQTTSNYDNQGHPSLTQFNLAGYSTIPFGGAQHMVYRSFLAFDVGSESDLTDNTVEECVLYLHQLTDVGGFIAYGAGGRLHICKGTGSAAFTSSAAWNDLDGWASSGSYDGVVTEYANDFACVSNTTYSIDLNSTAITDLQSLVDAESGNFYIGLINSWDFLDTGYTAGGFGLVNFKGAYLANMENATSGYRPSIKITYSTPAGVTHDAILFGTNF